VKRFRQTSLDRILRLHPRPKNIIFSSSKNVLRDEFALVKFCVVRVEEETLERKANHCGPSVAQIGNA